MISPNFWTASFSHASALLSFSDIGYSLANRSTSTPHEPQELTPFKAVNFVNYSPDSVTVEDMDGQGSEGTMVSLAIEETLAVLTRCSFEENHRQPILNLGGVPALAELVQVSFID